MSLNTLFQTFPELQHQYGENGKLPLFLQAGFAMLALQANGLELRRIEHEVYRSLRQEYIRSLKLDEDTAFRFELINSRGIEYYRQWFEETVEWVKKELSEDGYLAIVHPIKGRTSIKKPHHVANVLSGKNPFVLHYHVQEAQRLLRKSA